MTSLQDRALEAAQRKRQEQERQALEQEQKIEREREQHASATVQLMGQLLGIDSATIERGQVALQVAHRRRPRGWEVFMRIDGVTLSAWAQITHHASVHPGSPQLGRPERQGLSTDTWTLHNFYVHVSCAAVGCQNSVRHGCYALDSDGAYAQIGGVLSQEHFCDQHHEPLPF